MPGELSLRRDRRRAAETARVRSGWARVRGIIATSLLAAVSLFALIAVVIPLLLGAQTYTVLTGSMQPGMPPGTLIAVRPTPLESVQVGDVVTYQIRSGSPAVVTHRVVGTSRSTGGERLLLTRGDANDADDPPVQREQLRGTVVLAVPYLGYPGVVFGGEQRGAMLAAVGVIVVGYGLVLLVLDAARSTKRRRSPPAATLALIAAIAGAPVVSPDAASASTGPPDRLLVSDDGVRFVADGSILLFDAPGPFAPGTTVSATLWIRNASADPARAGLRLDAVPSTDEPADRAFAEALHLLVDSARVASGAGWVSGAIPPDETLRVAVGLRMDAAADDDTRRADAVVTPVISLTDETDDVVDRAPSATDALSRTGLDLSPLRALLVIATAAALLGLGLRSRSREQR
ncbi:signal peptidase I [Microbacterium sp. 22296]|uniref:signal peptidase I n=1 Tax=Microbacterium sp. 22296 TaxID=3453903 RepID=UPI003F8285D7